MNEEKEEVERVVFDGSPEKLREVLWAFIDSHPSKERNAFIWSDPEREREAMGSLRLSFVRLIGWNGPKVVFKEGEEMDPRFPADAYVTAYPRREGGLWLVVSAKKEYWKSAVIREMMRKDSSLTREACKKGIERREKKK